ncbi:MAG: nickel-dependent lactate racemase [Actinobacteria bacterium]|nr:nickel-dependent lactate racemase [Actinomycetota bacterium]
MIIGLDYGKEKLNVDIPEKNLLQIIESRKVEAIKEPEKALAESLSNPYGCEPLSEKLKGKKDVCIIISDSTRAAPTGLMLKVLLPYIESYGIKKDDITILIATGLHRPNLGKELEDLVGKEIANAYRIINHNARDRKSCKEIGKTRQGTPVIINEHYANADFKILTGLIEPHFMAGFSGGRKAICPGISYLDMFKYFHGPAILESPKAAFGILEGNPFHEEATEIAKLAGVDFIVNTTINKEKEITGIFCGELEQAFYMGADFCMQSSICYIDKEADIVITTGGGTPLDATLYQVVKGMVGAMPAVRRNGIIITAAECTEEIGSREFVELVQQESDLDEFMRKINDKNYFKIDQWELEEFVRARRKAEIFLYSGCLLVSAYKIPPATLTLVKSVDEGLQRAFKKLGKDATINIIPEGPYVIPVLKR